VNPFVMGLQRVSFGRNGLNLLKFSAMLRKTIFAVITKEGGRMKPIVECVEECHGAKVIHIKVGNKLYAYVVSLEWQWKRFWNYYKRGASFKALLVLKNHARLVQKGGQYVDNL